MQGGGAAQVEEHGHVVGVVGGIEPGDVDEAAAQAVSKVAGEQGRLPRVIEEDLLALLVGVLNILVLAREPHEPAERQQQEREAGTEGMEEGGKGGHGLATDESCRGPTGAGAWLRLRSHGMMHPRMADSTEALLSTTRDAVRERFCCSRRRRRWCRAGTSDLNAPKQAKAW